MANNDAPYDLADSPIEGETPISVPDSAETGEGGKVKMIVQLVKKCLGVKDIAAMLVLFNSSTRVIPSQRKQASVLTCFPHGTDTQPRVLALPGQTRYICCVELMIH